MFALHERAKVLVKKYFEAERELISLLQEIKRELIYQRLGYASMHQYCTVALGLSDHQAYGFWAVARKCQEVPKLQEAIDAGAISVATATRLVPVIQESNSAQWLELAQAVPQKTLEREVAKSNPKAAIRERIRPISETLLEFKGAIDPETERLLLQCKELQAQKSQSAGSWNEVLKALALQYLKTNDPVEKAKRAETRRVQAGRFPARENKSPNLRYIPAPLKHQVSLRDRGECQARLPNGRRCGQRRWVEIHHRLPLSEGGQHTFENLVTLCSTHHDLEHREEPRARERR